MFIFDACLLRGHVAEKINWLVIKKKLIEKANNDAFQGKTKE